MNIKVNSDIGQVPPRQHRGHRARQSVIDSTEKAPASPYITVIFCSAP